MKYLNIIDAVKVLKKDLKSINPQTVQMKINNVWTLLQVSNYIASYQTEANDLILVEIKDLGMSFTVTNWDINFTIGQQIRNEL